MTFGIIMSTRQRVCYSIFTAILLVLYLVLGAIIFVAIEGPYEIQNPPFHIETLEAIIHNIEEVKLALGNSSSGPTISTSLDILNETLAFANDLLKSEEQDHLPWNLQTGIHFCMTAVTTIGYGYIAPATQLGRGICIPYVLLGIPLNIFLSANLGFFIAQGILVVYSKIRKIYLQLCFSKRPYQSGFSVELRAGPVSSYVVGDDREERYCDVLTVNLPESRQGNHDVPVRHTNGAYSQDEATRVSLTSIIWNENVPLSSTSKASVMQHRPDFIPEDPATSSDTGNATNPGRQMDVDEEHICPMWFILLILLAFCSLTALFVYSNENGEWTFLDASYFTIISFTTVGFGDMKSQITKELGSDKSHKWRRTVYTYVIMEVGLIMVAATLSIWSENVKKTARNAKKAIKCNKITREIVSRISQTPEHLPV